MRKEAKYKRKLPDTDPEQVSRGRHRTRRTCLSSHFLSGLRARQDSVCIFLEHGTSSHALPTPNPARHSLPRQLPHTGPSLDKPLGGSREHVLCHRRVPISHLQVISSPCPLTSGGGVL